MADVDEGVAMVPEEMPGRRPEKTVEREVEVQSSAKSARRKPRRVPQPKCPIRYGEPCTACQPGTSGPDDCQLVDLVMGDPELHERMLDMNRRMRAKERAEREARTQAQNGEV
ncbi:DUF6767 domain-containing protein [Corynebacterium sp.]|uniref:DUF6767 domain-containing protein n=1 Tax=Corynebacterium sp. TaxID=1720 RepID=UPI0034A11FA2